MPFYWVGSVLMIVFILISLLILFFFKKTELMGKLKSMQFNNEGDTLAFNFLW
uniref:ATP synthase F0 subunit 8 n=1 Tax=Wadicosa fidelis TaxID=317852 RepID=A0A0U1XXQ3_WADFI|nr:ATP synthase F0 subunit 8 [Wadicosa fidelis]AIZ97178.1 ATP synthase F0 subunit 8 [Wadicosa fidelis]